MYLNILVFVVFRISYLVHKQVRINILFLTHIYITIVGEWFKALDSKWNSHCRGFDPRFNSSLKKINSVIHLKDQPQVSSGQWRTKETLNS